MSSDAVARQIYDGLSERDRGVVDAWRGLGNDLVTSLLRARVFGDQPRRRAVDDLAEYSLRVRGDADVTFRTTCEHEAAHAVVARHLPGVRLFDVVAHRDGTGETRFLSSGDKGRAAVYAAADQWVHGLRCHVLPRGDLYGCRNDRAKLVRVTGGDPWSIRVAEMTAFGILRGHRTEVLAFAEMLGQADGEALRFGS